MASSIRRQLFSLRLILTIGLAVGLLAVVAVLSYGSVSLLVGTLREEAAPKESLIRLKAVALGVENASRQVRAYSLTQDSVFLHSFHQQSQRTLASAETLDSYWGSLPGLSTAIDSFQNLLTADLAILDSMTSVADPSDLQGVILDINAQLAAARKWEPNGSEPAEKSLLPTDGAPSLPEKESPEKKKKFSLFGKKKEKDHPPPSSPAATPTGKDRGKTHPAASSEPLPAIAPPASASQTSALSLFEKKFSQISRQAVSTTHQNSLLELGLILRDMKLHEEIRLLQESIERRHALLTQNRAEDAAKAADRTILLITAFAVVATLLLIALVIQTLRHLRKEAQLQTQLQEQRDKAERLARAKEEFLAEMSHEIRTPLHAILGFTRLMRDTPLSPEQKDFQQIISDSSLHLVDLVNGLLEHAKLEAGKVALSPGPFRLRDLCRKTLRSLESTATEKGISLHLEGVDSLPGVVIGDSGRLRQVLINFLGNALKFTEKGGVSLICSVKKNEEGKSLCLFEVRDTGPGIPPEKLAKIFDPYEQAGEEARRAGGTGLGLTISKNIVELHGGKVWVESHVGLGSSFFAEIPYSIGKESELPVSREATGSIRFAGQTVLVVDDEPYNLRLTETLLKSWNLRPILAHDASQALSLMEKEGAHLVFMDLRMPGMNGVEASQNIRTLLGGKYANLPIVALSATIDAHEIEVALRAGMDAFLPKPFRESELRNMVLRFLPSTEEGPLQALSDSSGVDSLKKMSGGDLEFVREMLELFISSIQSTLEEMESAAARSNGIELGKLAHRMAGPTRHLGQNDLLVLLKGLEKEAEQGAPFDRIARHLAPIRQAAQQSLAWAQTELQKIPV